MTDWAALATEAAESLRGTCKSLDEVLVGMVPDPTNELPHEFYRALDTHVFLCDDCGWWEEVSEMSVNDQVCIDCNPEEDDDG